MKLSEEFPLLKMASKRLKLRKLTMLDADDVFEYTSNKESTKMLSWNAHTDKKQACDFVENTLMEYKNSRSRFTWGIELSDKKKLIGVISVFNISDIIFSIFFWQ